MFTDKETLTSRIVDLLTTPHLAVKKRRCLRLRHKGSKCSLCLQYCPLNAIDLSEPIQVDQGKCEACGICYNVCPTQVFSLRSTSSNQIISLSRDLKRVEFFCSLREKVKGNLPVPCLGFLDEATLLGCLLPGKKSLLLNGSKCAQCNLRRGWSLACQKVENVKVTLEAFGRRDSISLLQPGEHPGSSLAGQVGFSRRKFFSYLKENLLQRASVLWEERDSITDKTPTHKKAQAGLTYFVPEKRSTLLRYIRELGQPQQQRLQSLHLPFAELKIEGNCAACDMCALFCPTRALSRNYQEGSAFLTFNSARCLKCDLCLDICPEGSLSFSPFLDLTDVVEGKTKILIEQKRLTCSQCGNYYVSTEEADGEPLCPACRKKKGLEESLSQLIAR